MLAYKVHRTFLKNTLRNSIDFRQSAQHRGQLEQPNPDDTLRISLRRENSGSQTLLNQT